MSWLIKNESGFSMVQASVLAIVVGLTAVMGVRFTTDAKKVSKSADSHERLKEFHEKIYANFQNGEHCKETIIRNGKQVELDGTETVSLNEIWSNDALMAKVGKVYMGQSVSLENIEFSVPLPESDGMRNLILTYQILNADSSKRTGERVGGKNHRRVIKMRIEKDSDHHFHNCYAISSANSEMNATASSQTGNDLSKEFCQEITARASGQPVFIWNEQRSRCEPNGQCPTGQLYTGIDTDGNVICKYIRDWFNFNLVIDNSSPLHCPAGVSIRLQIVGNKIKLVCL
jgi:hypothetical protein